MVEKTSLGVKYIFLMAMLVSVFSVTENSWAQKKDLDKSFSTVVMIEGKHQGTTSFGAGIVIGSRAGRIYIATANHVVRSGRTAATDIKVQFRFLPGEKYDARLLDTKNTDLDIAVISVTTANANIPATEFNYRVLGDSAQLKRGSDVHPLGYPQAQAWGVALNPEKVDSIKVSEIAFQSSYIQKGHSGGALLDSCGDIVGLIVRDRTPTGEAVRIESVLQELRRWNYPIDMKKTGGCAPVTVTQQPIENQQPAVVESGTSQGSINIRYIGDTGNCAVNIVIQLEKNNRFISPTGNFFSVDNLELGDEYYTIIGTIECPLWGASCTASGEDDIFLEDGQIYDIVWENADFGECDIGLFNLMQ